MSELLGWILVGVVLIVWGIVEVRRYIQRGDWLRQLRLEDETYEEWRERRGWPKIDEAEIEALIEKGALKAEQRAAFIDKVFEDEGDAHWLSLQKVVKREDRDE